MLISNISHLSHLGRLRGSHVLPQHLAEDRRREDVSTRCKELEDVQQDPANASILWITFVISHVLTKVPMRKEIVRTRDATRVSVFKYHRTNEPSLRLVPGVGVAEGWP